MFDSGIILKKEMLVTLRVKGSGYEKNFIFWFKQVFEYERNIWCFHMLQDDWAEDGIKKEWTHL